MLFLSDRWLISTSRLSLVAEVQLLRLAARVQGDACVAQRLGHRVGQLRNGMEVPSLRYLFNSVCFVGPHVDDATVPRMLWR